MIIPETYLRCPLFGAAFFLHDNALHRAPINKDGIIEWQNSVLFEEDGWSEEEYDNLNNVKFVLEDVEQ